MAVVPVVDPEEVPVEEEVEVGVEDVCAVVVQVQVQEVTASVPTAVHVYHMYLDNPVRRCLVPTAVHL